MLSRQLTFDDLGESYRSPELIATIEKLSAETGSEGRGAIFTRSEVVNFILDLVGYTEDKPIYNKRLLEPSFGGGEFLLLAVERLLAAWQQSNDHDEPFSKLENAIRAVELHRETFSKTYLEVVTLLKRYEIDAKTANKIANSWLINGDFLLSPFACEFDFIVGNPPYVRQELIPAALLAEYRNRYQTMYDRADLYVPFIERSLTLLSPDGTLGFICADRWMKNRYGGPLRNLISEHFHLKIYVDMVDTPAFQSDVNAYPAITIISREKPGATRAAYRPQIDRPSLTTLAKALLSPKPLKDNKSVLELPRVTNRFEPWLLDASNQISLIRRLEHQFPCLENVGCKVGIGVATGADKAFIADYQDLDVELDRKLPLVTTKDIASGEVQWRGLGVVNPFADNGGLVNLHEYPRLKSYLEARRAAIAGRHCAKKTPDNWYRTIDRINPALALKPKLLIPDIKGNAHIVFEEGNLYPHHNLYYVTSEEWDLRALQAVLLSEITRLFMTTYSTKMRGGFMRFQAQYLRRLRLPRWGDVPKELRKELADAAVKRDVQACNAAVQKLYAVSSREQLALRGVLK